MKWQGLITYHRSLAILILNVCVIPTLQMRACMCQALFIAMTTPRGKQLLGGGTYFGSQFQRFWSEVSWLDVSDPGHIIAEGCLPCGGLFCHTMTAQRGLSTRYVLQKCISRDWLLLAMYCFPIVHPATKSPMGKPIKTWELSGFYQLSEVHQLPTQTLTHEPLRDIFISKPQYFVFKHLHDNGVLKEDFAHCLGRQIAGCLNYSEILRQSPH